MCCYIAARDNMVVKESFYIGYRDIATDLTLKNSAILNMFEDIAGIHANQVGEGYRRSENTWLLTGYKVRIHKRPKYGEKVEVYTWGTEIKSITAAREFEIRNSEGELLITGLSNWVYINLKTRKIEKVTEKTMKAYEIEPEKTNFNETKLKKLNSPENFLYKKEYTIDWNWIDVNNHMNNIFYLDLAEIVIPDEIAKQNNFSSFEIMYKKEIKYQDKINCYYAETEDGCVITIKNEDSSEIHSIIKLHK